MSALKDMYEQSKRMASTPERVAVKVAKESTGETITFGELRRRIQRKLRGE